MITLYRALYSIIRITSQDKSAVTFILLWAHGNPAAVITNLSDPECPKDNGEEGLEEVQEADGAVVHEYGANVEDHSEHPEHHTLSIGESKGDHEASLLARLN